MSQVVSSDIFANEKAEMMAILCGLEKYYLQYHFKGSGNDGKFTEKDIEHVCKYHRWIRTAERTSDEWETVVDLERGLRVGLSTDSIPVGERTGAIIKEAHGPSICSKDIMRMLEKV
jgi:hypothetical protein